MSETRRKFDQDVKEGAVRLVRETGKPIAQVARELGIHDGTLGNWVSAERRRRERGDGPLSEDERAELVRLQSSARSCRCGVMCSSAVWPFGSPRRWAGSRGRVHRCPEGGSRHPARHRLPGAGGVPVVVLQVEGWSVAGAGSAPGKTQS